eukprot:1157629-Pelagomonas_calceolata.AAC.2
MSALTTKTAGAVSTVKTAQAVGKRLLDAAVFLAWAVCACTRCPVFPRRCAAWHRWRAVWSHMWAWVAP